METYSIKLFLTTLSFLFINGMLIAIGDNCFIKKNIHNFLEETNSFLDSDKNFNDTIPKDLMAPCCGPMGVCGHAQLFPKELTDASIYNVHQGCTHYQLDLFLLKF